MERCDKKGVDFDQGLKYFLKLTKKIKNRDFEFLTGSERFFDDFEKMNFSICFEFFDFSENLQKSIKSYVSDTNGWRESDFQVETIQNEVGEVYFRCTGTHFMTFFQFCLSFILSDIHPPRPGKRIFPVP